MRKILIAALFLILPGRVFAQEEEGFILAENTFRFGDYKKAAEMLENLLFVEKKLADPEKVIKAQEYLAASYFFLGEDKKVEELFIAILTKSPEYKLDPFYYPPPLIGKFNGIRGRLIELGVIKSGEEKKEVKKEEKKPPVTVEKTIKKNYYMINFLPFGAGQFQNRQSAKGWISLSAQGAGLLANVGSYLTIELLRGQDGKFSSENAAKAGTLRTVQYVSLGVFAAVFVWSVVDALVNYREEFVEIKEEQMPLSWKPDNIAGFSITF
ncbi:MAG: hypothetical protein FJ088_06570 [Deltaproteobacteria bacterium]|nr:hypothetical protein [Deltaproteobacteria bacterium]